MSKNDDTNKLMLAVVIGVIGAMAFGAGLNSLFHIDLISIIGVLLGFVLGVLVYKF